MGKIGRNPSVNRSPVGEIPEAIRERPQLAASRSFPWGWLILAGVFSLLTLGAGFLLTRPNRAPDSVNREPEPVASPALENVLGHLPYEEAAPSQLKPITADGYLKLRAAAAEQFLAMQKAARAQGIVLAPISAFRTVEQQNQLFFAIKQQRNQEARKRAEVSAPPGYSEHHTGYAVDIGDGARPATNLSPQFENTPAFRWLKENAAKYSFELSFPPDNSQGVSYEPWHWRFVGDRDSLETFYKAKSLPPAQN
ncbi:MAG: D-alanyl-D-alanine carboxypeptidase family protein [Cyanobacteria bacterium RI_101]|nr:D-alanyl-D-alanine carboxypeptidase family protein [Cyanobacteria bacterium RI_101]